MVTRGEMYQHYKHIAEGSKNNYTYEIIGTALDIERNEEMVVYKPLYESEIAIFVRPTLSFFETVELDGKIVPRYKKIK